MTEKRDLLKAPNLLSLSRIVFLPLLYLFLFARWPLPLFISFSILGSTDLFDGMVARKFNLITEIGKNLDTLADAFFVFSTAFFILYLYPGVMRDNLYLLIPLFTLFGISLLIPLIKFRKLMVLHTNMMRFSVVLVYFTFLSSFFIDITILLSIVIVSFMIGIIELIAIYLRFGDVDLDTRSYRIAKMRYARR